MTGHRAAVGWGEVWTAVRRYVDEQDGEVRLTSAYMALARTCRIQANPASGWEQQMWARFRGQVRRALERLAADGTLVKVGRTGKGPDGYRFTAMFTGDPRYLTPAAYEAAKDRDAAAGAERARTWCRWSVLWDKLEALGYHPLGTEADGRGKEVHLGLDDWEALVHLAGGHAL